MAGDPVEYTTLVAGSSVVAATLNTNFNGINTYLANPGLENEYIENSLHNDIFTWHMDEVPVGTERIGFKVPATYSSNGLTLMELQVFTAEVGAGGTVNVNIHTAFPPASGNKLMSSNIVCNSDGDLERETNFTTATHAAGNALFIEYVVASNAVGGVTITLHTKADNRS
tara:strand:+ start:13419 stop:13928 length:510 start_codon:yes stop_codon:yes gene_type:complete